MKLNISTAAVDRSFAKNMRRVRQCFQELLERIAEVEMLDPLQTSTMIVFTDEDEAGSFREVPNKDGVYQVIIGCDGTQSFEELKATVFDGIRRTFEKACFSDPDMESFGRILESWKAEKL